MAFIYREIDGLGFYEVEGWTGASGIFTTRLGGLSEPPYDSLNLGSGGGDSPVVVSRNRGLLTQALGLAPGMLKTIRQVHGVEVHTVKDVAAGPPMEGFDALVTAMPGVGLGVLTADCVPILLYDPVKRAVGSVHAGWAGTVGGIAGKAVAAMAREYGSDPVDVLAAVGPSIGPCCYEVDGKVMAPLQKSMRTDDGIVNETKPGHWLLDLWEANSRMLMSAGVPRANITIMGVCTACNTGKFYSHRKCGGQTGRMMAVAWLSPGR